MCASPIWLVLPVDASYALLPSCTHALVCASLFWPVIPVDASHALLPPKVESLVNIELAYINTNHPDFQVRVGMCTIGLFTSIARA